MIGKKETQQLTNNEKGEDMEDNKKVRVDNLDFPWELFANRRGPWRSITKSKAHENKLKNVTPKKEDNNDVR